MTADEEALRAARSLEIAEVPVMHSDALALIAGSEAEQSAIYPPEVRFAFSPEELVAAGVLFLVARRGGVAVGCGGLADCGGYGELKRIFTAPEARRTGVGRAIVAALEDRARGAGLILLRLETGEASPEALALYERLGYRRCGPFGDYVENGSSVFMEKAL